MWSAPSDFPMFCVTRRGTRPRFPLLERMVKVCLNWAASSAGHAPPSSRHWISKSVSRPTRSPSASRRKVLAHEVHGEPGRARGRRELVPHVRGVHVRALHRVGVAREERHLPVVAERGRALHAGDVGLDLHARERGQQLVADPDVGQLDVAHAEIEDLVQETGRSVSDTTRVAPRG